MAEFHPDDTNKQTSGVTIGDVKDGIQDSKIAGRDIIEIGEVKLNLTPVTAALGQPLPMRNLSALLETLRQALPHLDPAQRAATQAASEKLEQAIAALPAHEQAYRELIKAHYAQEAAYYVPLAGQATEAATLPVEPKAPRSARRRRQRAAAEYCEWIQAGQEIQRVKLDTLEKGVARYSCIILLGDPGSGKTTALEHLAYQLADEPSPPLGGGRAGEGNLLPLPLRLSRFRPGMTLEEFILQGWAGSVEAGHWGAPELAANLEGYLEAGRLFVLFDALNEMSREGYAERSQALRRFIDEWSPKGNRFLVTCRVLDYGEELSGLQRVEVLPLDEGQIKAFLRKELPDTWEMLWEALLEGEDEKRRLLDMARNPYLLTMMIDVYAEDGRLGENRAELLERFAQILMHWAQGKHPPDEWLEGDVQREALSVMAYEMQARAGSGAMVETKLIKTVMPRQVQTDPQWPAVPSPPDRVLSLAAGAHIVEMPGDCSSVRFYHQLLQEYFAAHQMLKRDPKSLADLWRWPWLEEAMPLWVRPEDNYDPLPPPPPTGWEETTVLAAGLAAETDDQLVRALIEFNPVLAGRCLYEGQAKVDQTVRQTVIDSLLLAIADPEVALRVRIAAGEVLGYLGDPRLGEMVVVRPGKFIMGDDRSEYDDERPQHELYLPAYRLGKYPVTNAEYGRFIVTGGYRDRRWWTEAGWTEKEEEGWAEPRWWADSRFNQPNQPVVGVSWYECVAYCRWLSAERGEEYRLPSEAEWEKGARGTEGWRYPWGDEFDASRLNANEGKQVVRATTPVGIYLGGVSPSGAFDCAGNVWEWCATKWGKPYPYDVSEDEWSDGYLAGNDARVLRGGSWFNLLSSVRCAYRVRDYPDYGNYYIGFRLVPPFEVLGAEFLKFW
jgi:formylglycine-generating enzyme required for sulfatase activity